MKNQWAMFVAGLIWGIIMSFMLAQVMKFTDLGRDQVWMKMAFESGRTSHMRVSSGMDHCQQMVRDQEKKVQLDGHRDATYSCFFIKE